MRTLVTNGTIVTADQATRADVLIEDDRIVEIAPSIAPLADHTIDANGKLVLPGGIDVHTHLDMPIDGISSSDDFESGTVAAACGGTTSIIDFATQSKGQSLRQALDTWMGKADGKAAIDYGFHLIVTDLTDEVETEMAALVGEGIPSFKLFMAYPGTLMLDDGAIFRALLRTRESGGQVSIHAENGHVIDVLVKRALAAGGTAPRFHAVTRPAGAEAEAVHRAIALAEMAGAPVYLVHLSTAQAAEEVGAAKKRGLRVFGETCPQYLLLSEERYREPGFAAAAYVMSPPLRTTADQDRLWRALSAGELDVVATDHCPFMMKGQKELGLGDFSKIPNGAPGIEFRMSLLYDSGVRGGRLSLTRFVEVTSTAPARLFGLYPRKGTIAPGSDADLVIFDPNRTARISAATHHMRVDYNPYEGREVAGIAETVLSRGRTIVEHGRFVGRAGAGAFLRRAARERQDLV
jgi:dihydropyrimidinase